MCKQKGLNHLLTDKNELYDEAFGVPTNEGDGDKGKEGETDDERKEKLLVQQKNRDKFDDYVIANVSDKLDQALLLTAPVPDTTGFNPHIHRPPISRLGTVAGLVALGVDETTACNMAETISNFPAKCEDVRGKVSKHWCKVCHQHELRDGTRVRGFLPRRQTVGLKVAPWSEWQQASTRYGDRKGQGVGYVRNICEKCWIPRNTTLQKCYAKRKVKSQRMQTDLKNLTPQRCELEPGGVLTAEQKKILTLMDYCAVHRTKNEKRMWRMFTKLSEELNELPDKKAREHKVLTSQPLPLAPYPFHSLTPSPHTPSPSPSHS